MNAQCTSFDQELHVTPDQTGSLLVHKRTLTPIVTRLKEHFVAFQKQRESRDAFKHLLSLDDNLLRDIGVSRADVEWAASLPYSTNAASALNECAEQHKRLKDLL